MAASTSTEEAEAISRKRGSSLEVSTCGDSLPLRIWAVDVSEYDEDDLKSVVEGLLTEQSERDRVLRYLRPIDQIHIKIRGAGTLAGKLLIRLAVLQEHGVSDWHDVRIATTSEHRPFLTFPTLDYDFDFNVTHDGDWVAIVFTLPHCTFPSSPRKPRLGIDVMETALPHYEPSVLDFVKTMEMTMTHAETQWVRQGNSDSPLSSSPVSAEAKDQGQLRRLFSLWTHKEAYTKALGLGMGFDFRNVELRFWDPDDRLLYVNGQLTDEDYSFLSVDLPCGGAHRASPSAALHGAGRAKGSGCGHGSQLVVAYPTMKPRWPATLKMERAKESGLLHLWRMQDLVETCKSK